MKTRKVKTITAAKVKRVKDLLSHGYSTHKVASLIGVSQYTVCNIAKGKYDTEEPLVPNRREYADTSRCPITGLKMASW